MDDVLKNLIAEWLRLDKNDKTRNEVQALVDAGNVEELSHRMRVRIAFGTAGLRGRVEAGWGRMNDLTVIQASQGLCAYVLEKVENAAQRGIVIGHDHRYNSERWAQLTAAAFIAKGVAVKMLEGLNHTPLVPFSVKNLGAACGVMITASHNPKDDNGYKVYWENAVQIIDPHDTGIAKSIENNLEPTSWDTANISSNALYQNITSEMRQAYFEQLAPLATSRDLNASSSVKFVSTPMHGVGNEFAVKAFEVFGLPPFTPVPEQQRPDPDFPTVKFPNPEEKGALDLAMRTATEHGASYVLAQDPDADRFAAAERSSNGDWTPFTGDQLGIIFAARRFEAYKQTGKPLDKLAMVASTVSSKMLEAMAAKEGFKFVECLTGFKYIGNTALDLVAQGYEVPFGYEEAIGYMFGSTIRDKDGVAATVVFAELAVQLAAKGQTISSFLGELYAKYGYFKTSNSYFVCHDPKTIDSIFAHLRNYNGKGQATVPDFPSTIAGLKITSVRDLTVGYDSANPPSYKPTLPLSSGHMVQFRASSEAGDTQISLTIRTSGTEPKIKYYLEGSGKNKDDVVALLPNVVAHIRDEWMQAEKNGLKMP